MAKQKQEVLGEEPIQVKKVEVKKVKKPQWEIKDRTYLLLHEQSP